jgi:replication factor A1
LRIFDLKKFYIKKSNFRWTIKARISNKSQIRNYENARGPGKLFSCDLVDQSGEIRATSFNAECDKYYSLLEVGEVYFLSLLINSI